MQQSQLVLKLVLKVLNGCSGSHRPVQAAALCINCSFRIVIQMFLKKSIAVISCCDHEMWITINRWSDGLWKADSQLFKYCPSLNIQSLPKHLILWLNITWKLYYIEGEICHDLQQQITDMHYLSTSESDFSLWPLYQKDFQATLNFWNCFSYM